MLKFWTDFFFCIYKGEIDLQWFWLAKEQRQMEQWSFCFATQGSSSACSSGLCRAGVDLVSSSKGRDRQRPWDLKVGRVRKVRFGSTQQSNPDPSAHLARLATHWPERPPTLLQLVAWPPPCSRWKGGQTESLLISGLASCHCQTLSKVI